MAGVAAANLASRKFGEDANGNGPAFGSSRELLVSQAKADAAGATAKADAAGAPVDMVVEPATRKPTVDEQLIADAKAFLAAQQEEQKKAQKKAQQRAMEEARLAQRREEKLQEQLRREEALTAQKRARLRQRKQELEAVEPSPQSMVTDSQAGREHVPPTTMSNMPRGKAVERTG